MWVSLWEAFSVSQIRGLHFPQLWVLAHTRNTCFCLSAARHLASQPDRYFVDVASALTHLHKYGIASRMQQVKRINWQVESQRGMFSTWNLSFVFLKQNTYKKGINMSKSAFYTPSSTSSQHPEIAGCKKCRRAIAQAPRPTF